MFNSYVSLPEGNYNLQHDSTAKLTLVNGTMTPITEVIYHGVKRLKHMLIGP